MGLTVLTAGIRVLVDLVKEINIVVKRKQITHLDIGGGLPANYGSDAWATQNVPSHLEYAQHLRKEIPELFTGEFHVITEFGQSLFAKCGLLASRVEWMKGTSESPIAIVHSGPTLAFVKSTVGRTTKGGSRRTERTARPSRAKFSSATRRSVDRCASRATS
jgi:diaminopimelate decarboxylase